MRLSLSIMIVVMVIMVIMVMMVIALKDLSPNAVVSPPSIYVPLSAVLPPPYLSASFTCTYRKLQPYNTYSRPMVSGFGCEGAMAALN